MLFDLKTINDGLNVSGAHRFVCLSTWSQAGGTPWGGLGVAFMGRGV